MTDSQAADAADPLIDALKTDALPALGPERRNGTRSAQEIGELVAKYAQEHGISHENGRLLESLSLLWHDHLEPSHEISQELKSASGSLVHGIMHRREPDYSNAKYWFRRADGHPAYPAIAAAVRRQCASQAGPAANALASIAPSDSDWDAAAFVDCIQSERASDLAPWLQEVQRVEFETLIRHFCSCS